MLKQSILVITLSWLTATATVQAASEPYAITDRSSVALIINGKQLNFEVPNVAILFSKTPPRPVSRHDFRHAHKKWGTVRRGAKAIDSARQPGCLVDDQGNKWPINQIRPLGLNGSALVRVSAGEFNRHPTPGHLRVVGQLRHPHEPYAITDGSRTALIVNHWRVEFEVAQVARLLSKRSVKQVSAHDFRWSHPYLSIVKRAAQGVQASGQPGALVDDQGIIWPVNSSTALVLNESSLAFISTAEYGRHPVGAHLRAHPKSPKKTPKKTPKKEPASKGPFGYWFRIQYTNFGQAVWTRWTGPYAFREQRTTAHNQDYSQLEGRYLRAEFAYGYRADLPK